MAHVITRPCCNDASCVAVCPVNCIHPTPDEPEFFTAESLYIDPETCIDCGACIDECPVEAIIPDDSLEERDEPYLQINADYYKDHDVEGGLVPPKKAPQLPDKELHVAIVGAGPAAFYAAEELVRKQSVKVDMFERLPAPYGLVRAGVAPDHAATKGVEKTFASVAAKKNFQYFLNVEVGKHISHDELVARYHAVIYAVGASTDKRLGVEGEDLRNSLPATQFVAWYNGHPDYADLDVDLSSERAVVVGNGNVALDVARILVSDPDELAKTDIADHAVAALRESNISEVILLGRRGVAQGAFTNSEFLALGDVDGVDVVIDPDDLILDDATAAALDDDTLDSTIATKIRLAREFSERPQTPGNKRIVFKFLTSPVEIGGDGQVDRLTCVQNAYADGVAGRIVCVASADAPLKGVSYLLEAVAKLSAEREVELVLVSKLDPNGPSAIMIEDLAIGDRVSVVSGMEDSEIADLLASAEVACVPSLYEGFSLPAVEAMSCGTPLVATRAGAIPEVVGTDEEAAILVPPRDSGRLAQAIGRLLDDAALRARLGDGGRRRAEENYSWAAVAAKTAAHYETVLAKTGRTESGPATAGQATEGTTEC